MNGAGRGLTSGGDVWCRCPCACGGQGPRPGAGCTPPSSCTSDMEGRADAQRNRRCTERSVQECRSTAAGDSQNAGGAARAYSDDVLEATPANREAGDPGRICRNPYSAGYAGRYSERIVILPNACTGPSGPAATTHEVRTPVYTAANITTAGTARRYTTATEGAETAASTAAVTTTDAKLPTNGGSAGEDQWSSAREEPTSVQAVANKAVFA